MKKLKYILLISFMLNLLLQLTLFSQNFANKDYYLVDSLDLDALTKSDKKLLESSLKQFHKAKEDTSKINTLNDICENMMSNDWAKYQIYQKKIIEKALKKRPNKIVKEKLTTSLADALNNLGYISANKSDNLKAISYYKRAIIIYNNLGNKKATAIPLSNIGHIFLSQGNLPKALKYFHKALKIQEEFNNKNGIALSLNSIGTIYLNQKDFTNALNYFNKSLTIRKKIGDKKGVANVLTNIGIIHAELEEFTKALEFYQQALSIRKKNGDEKNIANSLYNIGGLYQGQVIKNVVPQKEISLLLDKSLIFLKQSYEIRKKVGDLSGVTISLYSMGYTKLMQGKINSAMKDALKCFKLAQKLGYPENIKRASNLLSQLYEKQGKDKQALEMYKLSITMRDSINNENTQKTTIQQQAKYEYEKQKALDDAENDKRIAIEKEAQTKQKVITYAIGIGLGMVVIFLIFVFNRLRVTKKQKLVIETQKEVVEDKQKEILDSINYAERIQRSFLATKELLDANLQEYFVFFQPKDVVSGDFYWADKLNNNTFAMVNADSTGHGVPGAIMSILNISSIEKAIDKEFTTPWDIFNDTRKTIIKRLKRDGTKEGGKDGMDASIICFDFNTLKMTYCAAQNPIWIIRDGEVIQIKPEKMPVGKHDKDNTPFVGGEIQLLKGDKVYTLTDGFQDQFGGPKGKKFMVKKMREYILSISNLSMEKQHQKISEVFANWKGNLEQIDDVCVIGVKI